MRYDVFPHQKKFILSDAKYPALVGGYGSGKTVAFCLKGIRECGLNPGKQILLAEPVYPMVKDVLQPTLEKVLQDVEFDYTYSASDLKYRVFWDGGWADILLRSAENYRRWAGLNLASFGLDEADLLRDDGAWKMGLSRLRDGNSLTGFVSTTPEGFGFVYDYWGDNPKEGYELIRGRTEDNTYLPPEFIKSLKLNYDERLIKAYMNGEFVNLQHGQTYYMFNREQNVQRVQYEPTLPIRIGMDFNVSPMATVLFQLHTNPPRIRVFDCMGLRHTEGELLTERVARTIKDKYPNNRYIVYPDPAAKARGTSARRSDHQILRDEGLEVRVARRAPLVIDRVNTMNKRFEDMVIDSKCDKLIKDFEQVVNREGTREIDKSNKELTHYSDGFGYAICKELPINSRSRGAIPR